MSHDRLPLEVISTLPDLVARYDALLDLYQRAERATPFQSPAWWLSWAEVFAGRCSLAVIIVGPPERPLACVPLVRYPREQATTLTWLGHGPSDYHDLLLDERAGAQALPAALEALDELARGVDRLELSDMSRDSPLLEHAARRGWVVTASSTCPVLELPGHAAEYERRMPSWLLRNARRSERLLARRGTVSWRLAGAHDLERALAAFFELHTQRWRARGAPGVLADPALREFHRRAAPRLLDHGALELSVLCLDGAPLAASYVLARRHSYLYLFGYDPELRGLSLGSTLILRSIEHAIERGRPAYDFLRGAERYKYDWGAGDTGTLRIERTADPQAPA